MILLYMVVIKLIFFEVYLELNMKFEFENFSFLKVFLSVIFDEIEV